MRKIEDFDKIDENGDYQSIPAGVYKAKITQVIDFPEREYLEIYYDIVDGEYKDYFAGVLKRTGKDYSRTFRSYKEKALGFFKAFITAIEKTNNGYYWNWDEKSLVGKYVVAVLGEEEYDDGESPTIRKTVKLQEFRSSEAYREGKIKVPAIKKLSDADMKNFIKRTTGVTTTIVENTANNVYDPFTQNRTTPDIKINKDDLPF